MYIANRSVYLGQKEEIQDHQESIESGLQSGMDILLQAT